MNRDPLIDALRAAALFVVVIGHYLMAGVWWTGGDLTVMNSLKMDGAQWAHWLTWILQPMPLLFTAGAFANATSWSRAKGNLEAEQAWLSSRVRRLCVPTTTFVVTLTVVVAVLHPVAPGLMHEVSRRMAMPLWFLAVYIPITAATPAMVRVARQYGWRALAIAAAAIVAIDIVQAWRGLDFIGWINLPLVWLAISQAGVTVALCMAPRRKLVAGVACGALVVLFGAVAADWYPVSMIATGTRSNTVPPNAALAMLATAQLGLVYYWRAPLRSFVERPRVLRAVTTFGAAGMHVYLWHLTAMVVLIGVQRLGVLNLIPLTSMWWITRPVVITALLLIVAAVALPIGRSDLRRLQRSDVTAGRARSLAAAGLGAAGCGTVTVTGFGGGAAPLAGALGVAAASHLVSTKRGVGANRSASDDETESQA